MSVVDRALEMAAPQEARHELLDELRPHLERTLLRVFGNDVLIAVYDRAGKKTKGGIIVPETNREDEFQGITGLILDFGPLASRENQRFMDWFGGDPPKIGDWIGFNTKDGIRFKVGEVLCRSIEWQYLRFATHVPDLVM